MGQSNRGNVLLVELLVAMLFFMLSATVLLNLFSTAYDRSVRAQLCSDGLAEAQNLAAKLTADGDAEALLSGLGAARDGEIWRMEAGDVCLEVELSEEDAPAGTICGGEIRAVAGGETLVAMPWARYLPEEVLP